MRIGPLWPVICSVIFVILRCEANVNSTAAVALQSIVHVRHGVRLGPVGELRCAGCEFSLCAVGCLASSSCAGFDFLTRSRSCYVHTVATVCGPLVEQVDASHYRRLQCSFAAGNDAVAASHNPPAGVTAPTTTASTTTTTEPTTTTTTTTTTTRPTTTTTTTMTTISTASTVTPSGLDISPTPSTIGVSGQRDVTSGEESNRKSTASITSGQQPQVQQPAGANQLKDILASLRLKDENVEAEVTVNVATMTSSTVATPTSLPAAAATTTTSPDTKVTSSPFLTASLEQTLQQQQQREITEVGRNQSSRYEIDAQLLKSITESGASSEQLQQIISVLGRSPLKSNAESSSSAVIEPASITVRPLTFPVPRPISFTSTTQSTPANSTSSDAAALKLSHGNSTSLQQPSVDAISPSAVRRLHVLMSIAHATKDSMSMSNFADMARSLLSDAPTEAVDTVIQTRASMEGKTTAAAAASKLVPPAAEVGRTDAVSQRQAADAARKIDNFEPSEVLRRAAQSVVVAEQLGATAESEVERASRLSAAAGFSAAAAASSTTRSHGTLTTSSTSTPLISGQYFAMDKQAVVDLLANILLEEKGKKGKKDEPGTVARETGEKSEERINSSSTIRQQQQSQKPSANTTESAGVQSDEVLAVTEDSGAEEPLSLPAQAATVPRRVPTASDSTSTTAAAQRQLQKLAAAATGSAREMPSLNPPAAVADRQTETPKPIRNRNRAKPAAGQKQLLPKSVGGRTDKLDLNSAVAKRAMLPAAAFDDREQSPRVQEPASAKRLRASARENGELPAFWREPEHHVASFPGNVLQPERPVAPFPVPTKIPRGWIAYPDYHITGSAYVISNVGGGDKCVEKCVSFSTTCHAVDYDSLKDYCWIYGSEEESCNPLVANVFAYHVKVKPCALL